MLGKLVAFPRMTPLVNVAAPGYTIVPWRLLFLCWDFYLIQNDFFVGRIYALIDRASLVDSYS